MDNYLNTNYNLDNEETVSVIDELPLWSAPFGLKLLEKIKYKRNIAVLDIGSGLGFPLVEVAMRLGNTSKILGIDPWLTAIERVKLKIRLYELTNVKIIAGVAENIPLPDNSIDLILSNNGLNNVDDVKKAIGECARVSKPGSQLIFTYNTEKTMLEFYSVFEQVLYEKNMADEVLLMKSHIYKRRKPVEEFVQLLDKSGFTINEIHNERFDYRFVDGSSMLNHFLIKLAFMGSWTEFLPKERHREIFHEIEGMLNRLADQTGLLQLNIPFVLIDCRKV